MLLIVTSFPAWIRWLCPRAPLQSCRVTPKRRPGGHGPIRLISSLSIFSQSNHLIFEQKEWSARMWHRWRRVLPSWSLTSLTSSQSFTILHATTLGKTHLSQTYNKVCVYMYLCTHVYKWAYMWTNKRACIYVCTPEFVCVQMNMYMWICIDSSVVQVCVHVHMHEL